MTTDPSLGDKPRRRRRGFIAKELAKLTSPLKDTPTPSVAKFADALDARMRGPEWPKGMTADLDRIGSKLGLALQGLDPAVFDEVRKTSINLATLQSAKVPRPAMDFESTAFPSAEVSALIALQEFAEAQADQLDKLTSIAASQQELLVRVVGAVEHQATVVARQPRVTRFGETLSSWWSLAAS